MIKAPEHIRTIKPYVPGKPVDELERELGISGSIKLASNENPLGPSPAAMKAIRNGLNNLNRYPEGNCFYLRKRLVEKLKIDPGMLIFGNGSNEIIELAVRTFLSPGEVAISAHPSFVVYPLIVQAAKGKNIVVPLKNYRHDLISMAAMINKKTRMIFIANPNNPTGTINTKKETDELLKKVPEDVLVVFDEAYKEYVTSNHYPETITYLRRRKNILILRTFSKIYGLAGLRIGYGIGSKDIIEEMNKVRQPFNVNSLAQLAATSALDDEEHLRKTLQINESGKEYLYSKLDSLRLEYLPTEANFIFVNLRHENAHIIYDKLLHQGIIVRPTGKSSLRITIGRPSENRKLITALKYLI